MAGSYPDIPGTRFDLSKDGSVVFWTSDSSSFPTVYTNTQVASVMDLDPTQALGGYHSNGSGSTYLTILFPEPRKITGLYWQTDRDTNGASATGYASYSLDTTDGINGTYSNWSSSGARLVGPATAVPFYRSSIATLSTDGVRAIRLRSQDTSFTSGTQYFRCVHVYGNRSTTQVDRLAFWHPTLDQELSGSYFDFGDIPRGSIGGARAFRIRNLSTTKNATGVQLTATSLLGSPIPLPGVQLSSDQTNWSTTTPAFSLNAGATTTAYYAQLNMSADATATVQPRSARISTLIGAYA